MKNSELYIIDNSFYFEKENSKPGKPLRIIFRVKDNKYIDIEILKKISKSIITDVFECAKQELEKEWKWKKFYSCDGDKPFLHKLKEWENWKNIALKKFQMTKIKLQSFYRNERFGIITDKTEDYYSPLNRHETKKKEILKLAAQ